MTLEIMLGATLGAADLLKSALTYIYQVFTARIELPPPPPFTFPKVPFAVLSVPKTPFLLKVLSELVRERPRGFLPKCTLRVHFPLMKNSRVHIGTS